MGERASDRYRRLRVRSIAPCLCLLLGALAPHAAGQCVVETVFHEDFESGAPGWTMTGNWRLNAVPACATGCFQSTYVALVSPNIPTSCGCPAWSNIPTYAPCDGDLISPAIALPTLSAGEVLLLDFCELSELDTLKSCGPGNECFYVEVSSASLERTYSLGGFICPLPTAALPLDLSEFQGEVVRVRWDPPCVDGEGNTFYRIDEVTITREVAAPVGTCTTSPNSAGSGALIAPSGSTSVAANDFGLSVSAAPPAQTGLFVFGNSAQQTPFGEGFLCVGGQVVRLPALVVDGAGNAGQQVALDLPPAQGKLLPGSTWHFQFWFRDPAGGGAGFNLSDALSATFCP